jgi:ribosomal protein L11 methyltransferase
MEQSGIPHRQAKKWLKIGVAVAPPMCDAVASFLADFTGAGVEIKRQGVKPDENLSVIVDTETVEGYLLLDDETNDASSEKIRILKDFINDLQVFFPGFPSAELSLETVLEEDWSRDWKKHFTAFHITPRLIIKPSWEQYPGLGRGEDEMVIELDPGLAFGTGHHASTQLALLLLDRLYLSEEIPMHVVDVGTGTGILAMACALLGAEKVVAVDNDPDAVAAAGENVQRNRLDKHIEVADTPAGSLQGPFDLVIANITCDVLTTLARDFIRLPAEKGYLVLAGILQGEQEESIEKTFLQLGLTVQEKESRDEWVAFLFSR